MNHDDTVLLETETEIKNDSHLSKEWRQIEHKKEENRKKTFLKLFPEILFVISLIILSLYIYFS